VLALHAHRADPARTQDRCTVFLSGCQWGRAKSSSAVASSIVRILRNKRPSNPAGIFFDLTSRTGKSRSYPDRKPAIERCPRLRMYCPWSWDTPPLSLGDNRFILDLRK
jgi:hypothetical protein